jgi:hypothetical protein
VSFSWPDDLNPFNNLGQENTQVLQAASPVETVFQLRNAARVRREFRFEVDTFQILPQPPCSETQRNGSDRGNNGSANLTNAVRQRNSRANNPLPAGWAVAFSLATPTLNPDEEVPITGTVTPPDTFHGTLPINIHVFSGTELIGGITIIVTRA